MKKQLSLSPFNLIDPKDLCHFNAVDSVVAMTNKFEDSTNLLWLCDSKQSEPAVIKVCDWQDVEDSDFWLGMRALFNLQYPQQMGFYAKVYELINDVTVLSIPELLACESATPDYAGFLYCSKLPGQVLEDGVEGGVNEQMVRQLVHHLTQLHNVTNNQFGTLFNPEFSKALWWLKIRSTITLLAEKQGVKIDRNLESTLFKSQQACPVQFVPIMPDLRWDQFLTDSEKLTGLVDLDAMVFGAVELEFVVLEYLLTEQQAVLFKQVYQMEHDLPDLRACRDVYRVLLFLMNILGEKSLYAWMQAPTRF